MIDFKAGTLIKGAYVVVNGVEHQVHMPQYSGDTPLSPEILNRMQKELLETVFPVGSTYVTQESTNPSTILGFGTWERLKGKVCLGVDEDDEDLNTIGKTGGEKTHTLTINEMPSHLHNMDNHGEGMWAVGTNDAMLGNGTSGNWAKKIDGDTQTAGGGQAHNNMQPYEITGYMWIRRA